MKKFSELTSRQARKYAWSYAFIIALFFAALIYFTGQPDTISWLIIIIGFFIIIPMLYLFFSILFNVSGKEYAEENMIAKARVISKYNLNKENSVKLKLLCSEIPQQTDFERQLFMALLPYCDYEARLTSNDEIEVKAFVNGNLVWIQIIKDYIYFERNFLKIA